MAAATSFEIRCNLLRLAYEIKANECQVKAEQEASKGYISDKVIPPVFRTEAPSIEDVVASAKQLNEFVCQSGKLI